MNLLKGFLILMAFAGICSCTTQGTGSEFVEYNGWKYELSSNTSLVSNPVNNHEHQFQLVLMVKHDQGKEAPLIYPQNLQKVRVELYTKEWSRIATAIDELAGAGIGHRYMFTFDLDTNIDQVKINQAKLRIRTNNDSLQLTI